MRKLHFFNDYLTEKYGRPLHRLPISLPLSCPNREKNHGCGCIYCAEDGNRARHLRRDFSLERQVAEGVAYLRRRYDAKPPYIAYFQSYTNTYGPVELLRAYYYDTLQLADFRMVIIATRPDCLSDKTLELLSELNSRYEVWVELGVQTSNDRTLERIRRGHDFAVVREATAKLSASGIRCAAHVILGLPGETVADFQQTARDIAALPFSAVKLHQLLVLKNTPLADIYRKPENDIAVSPLNEYEYAVAAAAFLKIVPEEWFVMRLAADADDKSIIAPRWWMRKGQFLEFFKTVFHGDAVGAQFHGVKTEDESMTLYHPEYRQYFHSLAGARSEAREKFVVPTRLEKRLAAGKNVRLLDVGFGLGYNAVAALETAESMRFGKLQVIALEHDRRCLSAARALFPVSSTHRRIIDSLLQQGSWHGDYSSITLESGDARQTAVALLPPLDIVFLDGFSPDKNPELWTFDFVRLLARRLARDGVIATYSSAFPVRGAMLRCGLEVGESRPFGRRRGGTVASFASDAIDLPLPAKEFDIIRESTAGVAYRDPSLCGDGAAMLRHRQRLVARLRAAGVPKWFKNG